jgi:hypothetical protein
VISIMAKLHKRTVRALTLVTGILGVLTLLWLIFDYVLYDRLQPLVLQFKDLGELKKLSSFIWLSFLFMFFFHLLAAGTLLIQMRYLVKIQALSILAIAVGVISFLGVFSDWAVLGDIGKEYKMGYRRRMEDTLHTPGDPLYIFTAGNGTVGRNAALAETFTG